MRQKLEYNCEKARSVLLIPRQLAKRMGNRTGATKSAMAGIRGGEWPRRGRAACPSAGGRRRPSRIALAAWKYLS